MKVKKLLKKMNKQKKTEEADNNINECNLDIIKENIRNEAIEAKLAYLIASSPPSSPFTMSLTTSSGESYSVYSGCQVAEPQIA